MYSLSFLQLCVIEATAGQKAMIVSCAPRVLTSLCGTLTAASPVGWGWPRLALGRSASPSARVALWTSARWGHISVTNRPPVWTRSRNTTAFVNLATQGTGSTVAVSCCSLLLSVFDCLTSGGCLSCQHVPHPWAQPYRMQFLPVPLLHGYFLHACSHFRVNSSKPSHTPHHIPSNPTRLCHKFPQAQPCHSKFPWAHPHSTSDFPKPIFIPFQIRPSPTTHHTKSLKLITLHTKFCILSLSNRY